METDSCHFFVDQPTSWQITSGPVNITGWVCDKAGHEITDIRARIDGVVTYGIMGYDRPDIQAFMQGSPAALRSGFWIQIRPWLGAKSLALEMLRPGNVWAEFFRTTLDVRGTTLPGRPPKPRLRAPLVAETLYYLYRHFHLEPPAVIRAEVRRVLAELTSNVTELHPEGDLAGHLDIPQDWVNAYYEKFRVSGWLFSHDCKISRVVATVGVGNENRLIWGKEREDVIRLNPTYPPHARHSQFYGLVDIRPECPSPACLKIFVEYADGSRRLCRARRLFLNKIDEHTGPLPVFSNRRFARIVWALGRGVLAGGVGVESWSGVWRAIRATRRKLAENLIHEGAHSSAPARVHAQDPYTLWISHHQLTPRLSRYLAAEARALAPTGPKISVVVPAYNTPRQFLQELIDGLSAQFYPNWELCIADDASPQGQVRELLAAAAARDARVKFVIRGQNGHISAATNSALELATGDFVAFLDHDDLLPPDALLHVAEAIAARPDAEMVYTDEDKIDESGRRYDPHFKGRWNPEMALTHNDVHHLKVIRRSLVEKAGRLREGYEGAQDIDLILRCVELMRDDRILHVPFVCYHWRAHESSTAQTGDQKGYLFDAARRGIEDALRRRQLRATAFLPSLMSQNALCLHQLKWDPALLAESNVTIVIPSKDRPELLRACVASLERTVNWNHVRLIIVDDGSTDPGAVALLAALEARTELRCRVLRTGQPGSPFNYSRLVNLGTAAADTPLVLHLNNDIEAREPGWLEDMAGWMSVSGVGVVGARLVRPDGRLDHAGLSINPRGGLPHSVFAGLPQDDFGYFFLPHAARDALAVTGACLLTRTDLYRQLGGFDERDFQVAYNDVDYCLRAAQAGYRTVYTPQATLTHRGSASRGNRYTEREHLAFVQRYPNLRDAYLSEVFAHTDSTLRVDPCDHRYARRPLRLRVAVITHNLNLEGAPLFIFEYARHLAETAGWEVSVFSPAEGPLRRKYEEAGLKVEVLDVAAILEAPDAAAFHERLRSFAAGLRWEHIDLIVGNTMLAYWAIHLAQVLDKPTALYIHESNSPQKIFTEHRLAAPGVIPLVGEAFRLASRVVFTARATREIHAGLGARDNFRTLASWVDIERIERFASNHDKRDLRRKHGLDPDATLVVNIGSLCQRKGQHIFIRGVDQLMKQQGAALADKGRLEFIMVGARPDLYQETIEQDMELMGLTNTRLVPETLDIYDWYQMADIFVCTSFEESFPRVLLESAAFKIPIISTNVNGIPEMLINRDEADLIPAGDYFKLAAAMKAGLDRVFSGDRKMTSMAFARVSRYYDARVSLAHHVAMAREAYFS